MTQTPEDLKKKAREETRQLCEEAYGQILDKEVIDATVEYWSKRTDTLIEQVYHAGFQLGWKDGHQEGIDARTEEITKEFQQFADEIPEAYGLGEKDAEADRGYQICSKNVKAMLRKKCADLIATLTPKISND